MQSLFSSWKTIVSVGAALGLLLVVGPTSPRPALAGEMGVVGIIVAVAAAGVVVAAVSALASASESAAYS